MYNSPHTPSIHTLDDDSLLNVFYLYRPSLLGNDDDVNAHLKGPWVGERWWCKLAYVCQRWRILIFESASYLGLSLVCTKGTHVADMLAHSHSLPLVIDYLDRYRDIPAEDEERAILALKQRSRVRRIRLKLSATNLQKLIVAIEGEYPILEYLIIWRQMDSKTLVLPETLEAPRLHHLMLDGFALPIESRLLATAVRLVTLCLIMNSPSTYFDPNTLLRWLSSMPRLEVLMISFIVFVPSHDEEGQLTHSSVMTPVTLPILRRFWFQGHGSYLEALVHWITPCPMKLEIHLADESTFSFPRLVQLMNTTENLKFEDVKFKFSTWQVSVAAYSRGGTYMRSFSMAVSGRGIDWQTSYVAQISNSFRPIFSAVERLALEFEGEMDRSSRLSEEHEHSGFRHIEWLQLFSSLSNLKTLRIDNLFVEGVSRCLQLDDGEFRLELFPELQEFAYCGGRSCDALTLFIDARQKAGRPVTLTCY
jgi:hypothetical protein